MRMTRTLRTAMTALRRNLMRAALTTLGIVIGVASVIAMMEIGKGSSSAIQNTIESMGANNLVIYPGSSSSGGVSYGSGSALTLTAADSEAISTHCPAVSASAPVVRARTQIVYGNKNWAPSYLYGTTPEFLEVRDWSNLDSGDAFTEQDVRTTAKVCLIGQTIVRELFGTESPIGKEIRVNHVSLKVIGTLTKKGANMMGTDQDDILLAPWTTIKYRVTGSSASTANQSAASATSNTVNSLNQLYPGTSGGLYPVPSANQLANTPQPVRFANIDQIIAAARTPQEIPDAIGQLTGILRERHRTKFGAPEDFSIRDMTEMTKALSSTTEVMTKLLLFVAMISLVVGGVGIMNIMLVSVTERTREIGLRMAVGARPRDILSQFMIEAVVLSVMGGALGIGLGRLCSYLVRTILNWPTEISLPAIFAAVIVSASVGIIFGFYPAWKASRLDPIDALRYE
ncbi:MAG: ABC transporter permease [Planctomycetota bacterium]